MEQGINLCAIESGTGGSGGEDDVHLLTGVARGLGPIQMAVGNAQRPKHIRSAISAAAPVTVARRSCNGVDRRGAMRLALTHELRQ